MVTVASVRRCLVVLLCVVAFPGTATAAPVLVLGPHGRVHERDDRFLSPAATTPAPSLGPRVAVSARRGRTLPPSHKHKRKPVTVKSVLSRLRSHRRISSGQYRQTLRAFNAALRAERRLYGTRKSELAAVTETVHNLAAGGALSPPRLAEVVATLDANRRWWTKGSLPAPDQRIEFAGSQLVWQYYPRQGIQLQVLGTFGKADGLYTAGPSYYSAMEQLLSEMIALASRRGRGLTWEYLFEFDGGKPPWTSAMSQATGLEALTRAYEATGNRAYLVTGAHALQIFKRRPPTGVAVPTKRGVRFLQYTFAPKLSIINAFLQTLIGLHDYAQVSGNATAQTLFDEGNAEAIAEVPRFDTGAWSLYQPGVEDDLSYHELVTGFLQELCTLTNTPVYCTTARAFVADETTPPTLADLTRRAKPHTWFALRFRLSKVSHVGIVITSGTSTVFSTSASFGYGVHRFSVPKLRVGTYGVRLAATDLAGNFNRITGTLTVSG
ncbi:MAG TPA: D-glucuronyl C5-epimerase family protein [Solirubrobacteraceae bacterium]|nr:D-glucuronyl C5-epimerase family protein [Solirubrobacteraceae bacterium]